MTTIPPQPPPPPPPPANALRSLPVVTVADPPAALAKLAAGTAFDGVVVSEAGKTAVQLQTVYGTVQIQTTLPLDPGARLTLVLQNLTQPLQLQIAAVDGKPTSEAMPGIPSASAAPAASAFPGGTGPSVSAAAGAVPPAADGGPLAALRGLVGTALTATVLRPAIASAPLSYRPGQSAIPNPAQPPGMAPPGGANAPHGPPQTIQGMGIRPSALMPSAGLPQGPAGPPFAGPMAWAAGTQMTVRVVAINPTPGDTATVPTGGPAAAATPLAGQTLTAVVTGTTTAGQPILRTPAGTLALTTPTPLPRGAEVVLEVRSEPLLAEPTAGPPPPPHPFALVRARAWPALAEAYQTLQSADPAAAQTLATATLPQANSRLTTDILFFLSALRVGDVGGWLSDTPMRVLRRDRPDLLNRLGEDFRQIGAMAHKPVSGDWRVALVPFFTGAEIEQIRLYLRPYGGEESGSEGPPQGVRFIVEVDLSRLGRMQMDGLVRDNRKRVDLIVRSDEPLPIAMQEDIRAIFEQANALTGVVGGLAFQAAPANFVDIGLAAEPADGPGLIA